MKSVSSDRWFQTQVVGVYYNIIESSHAYISHWYRRRMLWTLARLRTQRCRGSTCIPWRLYLNGWWSGCKWKQYSTKFKRNYRAVVWSSFTGLFFFSYTDRPVVGCNGTLQNERQPSPQYTAKIEALATNTYIYIHTSIHIYLFIYLNF